MGLKLKRYSADSYGIVDEQGDAVYWALKLANGHWAASDSDGLRVNDKEYPSPSHVYDFFETME